MDDLWTLRDHLNTVRKFVNAKSKVVSNLEYNAFGALMSVTGDKPLFRYTGKMFDDVTGLQWNINRWYDVKVGRWVSEDPIGFRGKDVDLCRYVHNFPSTLTDPLGLLTPKQEEDCCKDAVKEITYEGYEANKIFGFAMCCCGQAIACDLTDSFDYGNSKTFKDIYVTSAARAAIRRCVNEHENDHTNDMNCTGKGTTWNGDDIFSGNEQNCSEAAASEGTVKCMERELNEGACAGDNDCIQALNAFLSMAKKRASQYRALCPSP